MFVVSFNCLFSRTLSWTARSDWTGVGSVSGGGAASTAAMEMVARFEFWSDLSLDVYFLARTSQVTKTSGQLEQGVELPHK